jgi:hypothetical protein
LESGKVIYCVTTTKAHTYKNKSLESFSILEAINTVGDIILSFFIYKRKQWTVGTYNLDIKYNEDFNRYADVSANSWIDYQLIIW